MKITITIEGQRPGNNGMTGCALSALEDLAALMNDVESGDTSFRDTKSRVVLSELDNARMYAEAVAKEK